MCYIMAVAVLYELYSLESEAVPIALRKVLPDGHPPPALAGSNPLPGEEGTSQHVLRTFALKSRPESGRDYLLRGVPREQKMLKGHLPRVIYITKNTSIRRLYLLVSEVVPIALWKVLPDDTRLLLSQVQMYLIMFRKPVHFLSVVLINRSIYFSW